MGNPFADRRTPETRAKVREQMRQLCLKFGIDIDKEHAKRKKGPSFSWNEAGTVITTEHGSTESPVKTFRPPEDDAPAEEITPPENRGDEWKNPYHDIKFITQEEANRDWN